jgi:tetratricopeptide (TPR) repeat protein
MNRNVRLFITLFISSLPLWLLIFLMVTGDKAPKDSAIVYQGQDAVEKYEQNKEYQGLVAEGKHLAAIEKYNEAIKKYEKAAKINRVALPSYYVMLDMAKSQLAQNDKPGCKQSLQTFLTSSGIELSPARESNMFIVLNSSDSRLAEVKSMITEAKELLQKCER